MNISNTLILFRVLDNIFPHFFLTEERNARKERPREGKNRAAVLSLSTPTLRFIRRAAANGKQRDNSTCPVVGRSS